MIADQVVLGDRRPLARLVALTAALVGGFTSAYLLVEYVGAGTGICLTGRGCDLVRDSAFAYPLGVPMPAYGVAFFALAVWLTFRAAGSRRVLGVAPYAALSVLAGVGLAVSFLLTAIEAFIIGAFCSWCLVVAASSVVLFGAVVAATPSAREREPQSSGGRRRERDRRERAWERERGLLLGWSLAASALLGTGFVALLLAGSASAPDQAPDLADARPTLGSGPVEVTVFSDLQCPACGYAAPILEQLAAEGQVTLVFRHFPLESIHANAMAAARAAEAAGMQGAFWPFHDRLFASQSAWAQAGPGEMREWVISLAGQLELDVARLESDMDGAAVRAAVDRDAAEARRLRLPGTPSVFIDGEFYEGGLSLDALRAAVQRALAAPAAAA